MTKKVKSSNKYIPMLHELPFTHTVYGLFTCREDLDKVLKEYDIPLYRFDTDNVTYAATFCGSYTAEEGKTYRYAFVYAEQMLEDNTTEARKLSVLAHEAFHVAKYMFDLMGDDKPSEEVFAYTLGNVCQALFEDYKRWSESRG